MTQPRPATTLPLEADKQEEEQQGNNKRRCTKKTPERMKRKDEKQQEKGIMTVDLAGEEDEMTDIDDVVRKLDKDLGTKDIKVTDKRFWMQPIKGKTKRWTKTMQRMKLEGYKKTDLIGEESNCEPRPGRHECQKGWPPYGQGPGGWSCAKHVHVLNCASRPCDDAAPDQQRNLLLLLLLPDRPTYVGNTFHSNQSHLHSPLCNDDIDFQQLDTFHNDHTCDRRG